MGSCLYISTFTMYIYSISTTGLSLRVGIERMEEMSVVDRVGRLCLSLRIGVMLRDR